jgi:hypothetical protein
MSAAKAPADIPGPDTAQIPSHEPEAHPLPWEEIDTGRYMPRRIRGSCRGRVLG